MHSVIPLSKSNDDEVVAPSNQGRPAPLVIIIGAGPAGLTAGTELIRKGAKPTIVEASSVVGGISQTAVRNGWRFDLGGHRFFTKVERVEQFWHSILENDEFLQRPRLSRIMYNGKFYDYPLRAWNALSNLGVFEAARCVVSYGIARVRPPKDQSHFEGWVASRFGRRLYGIFFKTYTEKVWGVPATEIQADWAAQRIKNLSLGSAVWNALRKPKGQTDITSLIDRFQYPKFGPGMMWESCAHQFSKAGGSLVFDAPVQQIEWRPGGATAVVSREVTGTGAQSFVRRECDAVISSMPMAELVEALDPQPPPEVLAAGQRLRYRDFITVALAAPGDAAFPDNWIYIHDPGVRLGRIQNFASWSPHMVKEGQTCLGLEYFVNPGDDLSSMADEDLVALGISEVEKLGLVVPGSVTEGHVVRVSKAYPMYDVTYKESVDTIRHWLSSTVPNLHCVGRNGMHRYNNQDHSMFTAMLTVDNLYGATNDVWSVNVDEEYHEEKATTAVAVFAG